MSGPKRYRCVQPMAIQQYDEDGYCMCGQVIEIKPGTELVAGGELCIAVPPAVRLSGPNGLWLELYPDTLRKHFQEV